MSIALRAVAKGYGGITVLEDVSLKVGRGDKVALIGPNGGGKSALLKLLAGLERPDAGSVTVEARPRGGAGQEGRAARAPVGGAHRLPAG